MVPLPPTILAHGKSLKVLPDESLSKKKYLVPFNRRLTQERFVTKLTVNSGIMV